MPTRNHIPNPELRYISSCQSDSACPSTDAWVGACTRPVSNSLLRLVRASGRASPGPSPGSESEAEHNQPGARSRLVVSSEGPSEYQLSRRSTVGLSEDPKHSLGRNQRDWIQLIRWLVGLHPKYYVYYSKLEFDLRTHSKFPCSKSSCQLMSPTMRKAEVLAGMGIVTKRVIHATVVAIRVR